MIAPPVSLSNVPRCPKFASESVRNQEDHSSTSSPLRTDAKLFRYAMNCITVETGVEIHGNLDEKDERQDRPLLLLGKAEPKFVVAVGFHQLDLVFMRHVRYLLNNCSVTLCGEAGSPVRFRALGTLTARATWGLRFRHDVDLVVNYS